MNTLPTIQRPPHDDSDSSQTDIVSEWRRLLNEMESIAPAHPPRPLAHSAAAHQPG